MKLYFFPLFLVFFAAPHSVLAQNITYSEIEKADTRELNFEILGNFSGNFPIYKNVYKRHELTIYDNNMAIKETVPLDFISDKTFNIDFITYQESFIAVWQYEKGNTTYCKAVKISGDGKVIGNVVDMDTTKTGAFSSKVTYTLTWSEDKKKILMYKVITKNDELRLVTKLYDDDLMLQDSSRRYIDYNDNREYFDDLLVDNESNIIFTKVHHNSGGNNYINSLELNVKKLKTDSLITIDIPLNKQVIQDPFLKIDNVNRRYLINCFAYKSNGSNVEGMLTAVVAEDPLKIVQQSVTIFPDALLDKMSGRPDWRTAYDNFALRNIILKKDGGFLAVTEEYYKQRRYGSGYDDRYFPGNYNYRYGSASDYYLYNRGYYGYYRPYNDNYGRDVIYNYNDIINFSFTKDLKLQWNAIINKTTSDLENDNFLSFANMNSGSEIHFLFLQKDNNKQIISDFALQPDGSMIRYATLRGREAGYYFMPRLGRQTGIRQMIIPCIVRNNIAFAKIDF